MKYAYMPNLKEWLSKEKSQKIIFALVLLVVTAVMVGSVLDKPPGNTHMWRQTDCLSMTVHYMEGSPFLEPEMHIQLADSLQSGKSAGELPLLYWTVGNLWKVFGKSYTTYRIVGLLIMLAGAYALFLSVLPLFKSFFWSAAAALSLFFSPVYLYYGVSFLTDGPALAFALIAMLFLSRYVQRYRKADYWWAMCFFALVGLFKVSSMILFGYFAFLFGLELIGVRIWRGRKLFRRDFSEFAGIAAVLLAVVAWYAYAAWYNGIHEFKYTFNHIYPFWETDTYELDRVIDDIKNQTGIVIMSHWSAGVLGLMWMFNVLRFGKTERAFGIMNAIIPLGAACYVMLWFPLFGVHDYYLMPLVVVIPAIVVPFIADLKYNFPHIYNWRPRTLYGTLGRALFGIFVLWSLLYSREISAMKCGHLRQPDNMIVNNSAFIEFMNWFNYNAHDYTYQYYRIRPQLPEMGCTKDHKVIILSDPSFNIGLYMMDRKGWTDFKQYNAIEQIRELRDKGGAQFLFVFEKDTARYPFLEEIAELHFDTFEYLRVYDLREW